MSHGAKPQSPGKDPPPELMAIGDAWSKAIVSNDAERIGSFMAEDWVIVSQQGVAAKEEFLSLIGSGELTHASMDRVSPARVRIYGDTAVLTARVTNTAHYAGQRFDTDEWTTDIFTRRHGQWLCVLSHTTPTA